MNRATIVLALAAFALGGTAYADVVRLRDGRTLEGSVSDDGEYLIIRHQLGEARVHRSSVISIEDTQDAWDRLEILRKLIGSGTADERYRFAVFARENGFDLEARRAFLAVLRVDLDHLGARTALGYVRHEGQWLSEADRNRLIGLVEFKGRWLKPAQKAALQEAARDEALARRKAREDEKAAKRARRVAKREAEAEDRRERIAAYDAALARERARRAVAEQYDRPRVGYGGYYGRGSYSGGGYYGNGYYGSGYTGYSSGTYSGGVCRPIYGPKGIAGRRCSSGPAVRFSGPVISGRAGGSNWGLNWRVGF
jgi:hypothetical protein